MSHGDKTRNDILNAGVELWKRNPFNVSARAIARHLKLSGHAAVFYHFKNSAALRNAIAAHAVAIGEPTIIVQLITENHIAVQNLDYTSRNAYLTAFQAMQ